MMGLLLNRRGGEIRIIEEVIKAALDNQRKEKAVMELASWSAGRGNQEHERVSQSNAREVVEWEKDRFFEQ